MINTAFVADDRENSMDFKLKRTDGKLKQGLEREKVEMQSKLGESVRTVVPLVDSFVGTADDAVVQMEGLSVHCKSSCYSLTFGLKLKFSSPEV